MKKLNIMLMASHDYSMRFAMKNFLDFLNPTIKYKGEKFQMELGRVIAKPFACGTNVRPEVDVLVDRTIHWNDFYKCYAQTAANCLVTHVNSSLTNDNLDKHSTYDLMARAMHPKDHFPTTVLLPQFAPWTEEQLLKQEWETEQHLILSNTEFGWDQKRKKTDWAKVEKKLKDTEKFRVKRRAIREQFYPKNNYIEEAVRTHFNNKFPLFFKKAWGGGGSDVYKVNNIQELYEQYDKSNGRTFHIQEAVENYDTFIRCMGIGPQILAMRFQPDEPLHQHYSPEKLKVPGDVWKRMESYVKFINSYHRWTYNSMEALVKDSVIHPIDFANACPDSNFTSLHTHFPWLICSLIKWFAYLGATGHDLKVDTDQEEYLRVFNDPKRSAQEKFDFHVKKSEEYFQIKAFNHFVEENFRNIEDKMIEYYDKHFDQVIEYAMETSDFPKSEQPKMFKYYKNMMETQFRPNAKEYLSTDVHR